MNLKILNFHIYFFNMDISPTKALSCLKVCMYTAEICLERNVSQNFDIGLSFCLMVCRRWNFEFFLKKSQKLPVFCHKIKTKAQTKNLRHASLDKNVLHTHAKVYTRRLNNKRDIHVKKIKVKKMVINSLSSQCQQFRYVSYIIG